MSCGVPILNEYDLAFTTQLQEKTHTYELIENGQGRELILTDQNGDRIFYTNQFLNTEDFDAALTFKITPNPAQNFIAITGEEVNRLTDYKILDLQGKVHCQDTFKTTLDIIPLAQGLYFLILAQDQKSIVKRFIKN